MAKNSKPAMNVDDFKLRVYKTTLNMLRSRRLALEVSQIQMSVSHNVNSASTTADDLLFIRNQVSTIHLTISHLFATQKCLGLMVNSMQSLENKESAESRDIKAALFKISELINAIEQFNSVDDEEFYACNLQLAQNFTKYQQILLRNEEIERERNRRDKKKEERLQKAERMIEKINVSMVISRRLFASFFKDFKSQPQLDSFLAPFHPTMTIQHFKTRQQNLPTQQLQQLQL